MRVRPMVVTAPTWAALWAVIAIGSSAVPADAQRCLEGAAALGDQRALRALAAEIEAFCPCALFDGSPGRKHVSYVACAQQVRRNAVFLGTLREECAAEASKSLRTTTCGGTRVACGRFQEGARKPVSCRVKPAARCADRPRFTEEVCSQTHCSEVVEWTAGTCLDPRAPGPYRAGVRVIAWTKPSAVNPSVDRVLNTLVWYPTSDVGAPTPPYGALLNASVDVSGGPYPVVLFSHGSCGIPFQSTFLTAHLATHGFVVVAPPHPGNTLAEFPTCGTFPAQAASAVERPQDMIFVLDQIIAAGLDSGSDFFGVIDETRVGMSGHSFGGLTTYLVQAIEPRIKVALPMAAATSASSQLTVPSLTMLGQIDSVVSNAGIRAAYGRSTAPKRLVEIRNAGHYAFSGACFASSDCNPPVTLNQAEAHAAVLRYAVPFLHVALRGDAAWAPLLDAPPSPTFVVAAEP